MQQDVWMWTTPSNRASTGPSKPGLRNTTRHKQDWKLIKMATFKEAREALLLANDLNLIDEEEMLLLYDLNSSKNLDIPHWKYGKFLIRTRISIWQRMQEWISLSEAHLSFDSPCWKYQTKLLVRTVFFVCTVMKLYVCFYADLHIRVGTKTLFHGLEHSSVWCGPKRWIFILYILRFSRQKSMK